MQKSAVKGERGEPLLRMTYSSLCTGGGMSSTHGDAGTGGCPKFAPCRPVLAALLPRPRLQPSPPRAGSCQLPPARIWARKTEHFILRALPRCHRLVRWAILGDRLGAWHTHRAAGNSLLLFLKAGGWDPAGAHPCDSRGLTLLLLGLARGCRVKWHESRLAG